MIKKFLMLVTVTVAATAALSLSSTAAHADGYCGTVSGAGVCLEALPTVGGETEVAVSSPTEVCFFIDCIAEGESLVAVPVPVSGVDMPGWHFHYGDLTPVLCFVDSVENTLPTNAGLCPGS